MSSKDIEKVIKWEYSLIISDSLGCEVGKPHPRTYGSFPRIFSKYVKKTKTLTLEQAVRKVTSFPAQRFKLGKRGLLTPGYKADITIFNQETINDLATYDNPIQYPNGISNVFVNGVKVIEHKENLKVSNGEMIKASQLLCNCGK